MARGEKSHAWTKTSGYVDIKGKIVFPAPQPTCHSIQSTKFEKSKHNEKQEVEMLF